MEKKDSFKEALIGKRAMQGGVYNYLGEVKTVNAPIKWKSSAEHPIAFLSYITKEEMDILIKKNIYGSLKGKPNKGPFGLPSLQGSGSGSEGAGTADGGGAPGGPGGSEGFSTDTGPGPGEAEGMGGPGGSAPGGFDDFGAATAQSIAAFENSYATQQTLEDQKDREENPQMSRLSPVGIAAYNMSLANPTRSTTDKALGFTMSPIGTTIATFADTQMRGVTAPDDYSQLTESVQTGAPTSMQSGGGQENIAGVSNNSFLNNLPDRKAYDMNLLNTAKSSFNYFDPYNYAKSNPLYKTFSKGGIINILLN